MSHLVVVNKYKLKVKKPGQTGYEIDGQRDKVAENIAVSRAFVEARNSQSNNEYYEIDEEATKEYLVKREACIKLKAELKKKESIGQSDMVDAVISLGKAVKSSRVEEEKPKKAKSKETK